MPVAGHLASPALLHATVEGEGKRECVFVCTEGRRQGEGRVRGTEDGDGNI